MPPRVMNITLNLVLSTGLIMWIGRLKEIRKLTFLALALRVRIPSLRRRADARNFSFGISLRFQFTLSNMDETKLSCNTPRWRSTTVSLESYPLYSVIVSITLLWLFLAYSSLTNLHKSKPMYTSNLPRLAFCCISRVTFMIATCAPAC